MLSYEISPPELRDLLAAGQDKNQNESQGNGFVLLDVREPWEFEEGRIGGSLSMPTGDVPARAHQELDPESRIIAICHHGVRSMSVTAWLREQGFEHAQSLRGGIDGWSAEIDPTIPRY